MRIIALSLLLLATATTISHASEKLIELKDGTFLVKKKALEDYQKLKEIYNKEFTAFYDLRYKCEESFHSFMWKNSKVVLKHYQLIGKDKQPSNIVKAIMKNGAHGKNLLVKLVCPFKEKPK